MARTVIILLFSAFGGTFFLHYIKNFLLEEKTKIRLDWDGILERIFISYLVIAAPVYWTLIPAIIAAKAGFRLYLLGHLPGLARSREPGTAPQKVLLKAELGFDLFLSPAFAILVGAFFR